MWEIAYVIKNKNKYEKEEKERRKQELAELKEDGVFRVALSKEIKVLNTVLADSDVDYIDVRAEDGQLINLNKALYYEEMKVFQWMQSNVDANMFRFKTYDIEV